MAERYISHLGTNVSPYGSWAAAATTLVSGITGGASTDNFWVASDHSESSAAAQSIPYATSGVTVVTVVSVNRAGSVPPVAADVLNGGTVTTTGAFAITASSGRAYVRGLTFNCGTGATAASLTLTGTHMIYDKCNFNIPNTAAASVLSVNNGSTTLAELVDCSMSFGATGQSVTTPGRLSWRNSAAVAALTGTVFPTTLIVTASALSSIDMVGLDLDLLGSGKTIVGAAVVSRVTLTNCKLNASVTVAATPTTRHALGTYVIGCHSTTNVARNEIYLYTGTLTTETTIVRTAGASDGTTAYSWKIVPTANNSRRDPFKTFDGALWGTSTGASKTLTVHIVTDNVSLTDQEIWLEVEYLSSTATPISTFSSDSGANYLTTGTAQATSTEAWTTTGLTTPLKQKLEVTFTPQMAGPIRWRVRYAKAATTVYVDPKAELS